MLYSTGNITNFQGIFDTQIAHRMCYEDENNCISNGTKNNSISLSELLKINFGINANIKDAPIYAKAGWTLLKKENKPKR